MLFSTDEARQYVGKINRLLMSLTEQEKSEYVQTMCSQLITALETKQSLKTFDRGDNLMDRMKDQIAVALRDDLSISSLEEAHFQCARLLRILSFGGFQNFDDNSIVDFYLNPSFREIEQKKIDLMRFDVPSEYILEPYKTELNRTVEHVKKLQQWEEQIDGWRSAVEGSLQDWRKRVEDTERRYNNVVMGQNYLGLAQAFVNLIKKKDEELAKVWVALCCASAAALLVPALYLIIGNSEILLGFFSGGRNMSAMSVFIFSVVFETLLIYYFRIVYAEWRAIKHQILQLNLRHQMCAFANEYAHNSKDMDRGTLNKFENLVFSELTQDSNIPPSVYDAVDSIAKVLGGIRGKSES